MTRNQAHLMTRRRAIALAGAAALAFPLALSPAASAAPKLTIVSETTVPGANPAGLVALGSAEAADGTIYVASVVGGSRTVWAFPSKSSAAELIATTGLGPTIALAVDATNVYVGATNGINAYNRFSGHLVQHWVLSPKPRALSQLVVAGNRVWALLTPVGYKSTQISSMVELDPASPVRVRTISGLVDTFEIATSSSAVYYVTGANDTLVRLSNAGVSTTAKPHVDLSHLLDGPAGVLQAELVTGNTFLVQESFGQGDDAELLPYNATTLAGPGKGTFATDNLALASTALGLLAVSNGGSFACTSAAQNVCVKHFALGGVGPNGAALDLPGEYVAQILSPHAAVVDVDIHNKAHVIRIG